MESGFVRSNHTVVNHILSFQVSESEVTCKHCNKSKWGFSFSSRLEWSDMPASLCWWLNRNICLYSKHKVQSHRNTCHSCVRFSKVESLPLKYRCAINKGDHMPHPLDSIRVLGFSTCVKIDEYDFVPSLHSSTQESLPNLLIGILILNPTWARVIWKWRYCTTYLGLYF